MKKNLIILLSVIGFLLGAKAIKDNTLVIGNASNSDKEIVFDIGAGTANPRFLWDSTSNTLKFTNDNSEILEIGSGDGGGSSGINVVEEGGFEREAATTLWTNAGAGTFLRTTTAANIGNGDAAGEWNPAAASDTLTSSTVLVPNMIADTLCIAEMFYKGGGTADITMKVLDGLNVLVPQSDVVISDAVTGFKRIYTQFICPTEGESVKFQLEAAGDASVIYIDDVFVGTKSLATGAAGGWKTYRHGADLTVTTDAAGGAIANGWLTPKKDPVTGQWFLDFQIIVTPSTDTAFQVNIPGVLFEATSGFFAVNWTSTGAASMDIRARGLSNSNNIDTTLSVATSTVALSAIIPIQGKPTWADFDGTVNLLSNSVIYSNAKASFYVNGNTSVATIDGLSESIPFDATTYNEGGFTLDPTGFVTVNADGYYKIKAGWGITSTFAGATQLNIYKNGATVLKKGVNAHTTFTKLEVGGTVYLVAGDRITIRGTATSGITSVRGVAEQTFFDIERVADVSSNAAFGFGEADKDNFGLVKKGIFHVGGQWASTCASDPCVSLSTYGDVPVTNVTRLSTGKYRINFANPWPSDDAYTCVVNSYLGDNKYCGSSTNSTVDYWELDCFSSAGANADTRATFVCMGDAY